MDTDFRRFVKVWAIVSTLLLAAGGLFNIVMDPYLIFGIPRIQAFNARKPAVDTQERLMKAYDVLRGTPNTLILGSSRADLGLDAQDPAWPPGDRPVYNLGFSGGGPYISSRYLQHAMSNHAPSLVVMGIEFEYFLTNPDDHSWGPESESRLAVTASGTMTPNRTWQRAKDIVDATISLGALADSAETLIANFSKQSSDTVAGSWDWEQFHQVTAWSGSEVLLARNDLNYSRWYQSRWYQDRHLDPLVMNALRTIIDLCESHGTRLILFISPSRADELEIIDLAGLWQEFESWKREVLQLTTQHSGGDPYRRIPLWDFTGYDAYSAESFPVDGKTLHWFWDTAHYTRPVGDVIIRRIMGTGDGNWGVLLTPDNIETHLETIQRQQRLARERHGADTRRVRDFYESMAEIRARATR